MPSLTGIEAALPPATRAFYHESMGVLRELAGRKRPGQVLVAAGCLPALPGWEQTVRDEEGVDAVIRTQQWSGIADLVDDLTGRDRAPETFILVAGALRSRGANHSCVAPSGAADV